ncbi:hypothetical protein [Thioalkalivibrio sp. ALMg3]|uniref:hypothetical protein n=1 Tax=Thioalkalivibrio sp. ALMg3 TaxID=1158163 RepID=UPI0003735484|nr:hypothetical protein [Thioalkalivibrio sp. ALMg3]
MSEAVAFPFLRPSESRIEAGPWRTLSPDGDGFLPEILGDWDYSVDLELERSLRVDLDGMCSDAGLQTSSTFVVSVYLVTGELKIRRSIFRKVVSGDSAPDQIEIGPFVLQGSDLQGVVELTTSITLEKASRSNALAPIAPGSRLWWDRFICRLEGGGGRLPMEARNFSEVSAAYARAPWYFRLEAARLEDRFEMAFQVVLNSSRLDTFEAISREEPVIMSILQADLVRHVTSRLLDNDEFTAHPEDYPDGSVGSLVSGWLQAAFPELAPEQIRDLRDQRPADFDAVIASNFGGCHDS